MKTSESIDRREFTRQFAVTTAGALALGAGLTGASAATTEAIDSKKGCGVLKVVRHPKALESPVGMPPGEIWRYMLSYPFQIAPNLAGLDLNMKQCCGPGQDFEGGTDIMLLDRLGGLNAQNAFKVSRNHIEPNPNNGGKPAVMAHYPGNLGFVPFGAKGADGKPHPHAGTGWALVVTAAWPMDKSNGYATYPDRIGLTAYLGEKRFRTLEIYQLRYDGTTFTVGPKETLQATDLAAGFRFDAAGMGCAISDGDDLLIGAKATRHGDKASVAGLVRWRRINSVWRAVDFEMVTPADNSLEPSVVRDIDGSLLFNVRGPRSMGPPIRIWRRAAPGQPWELRINQNGMLPSTPVTLCQAVDGTPFLAGNLYQPPFRLPQGLYSDGGISRLEPVGSRGERSTICIWPLNEARDGLDAQFIAKDPLVEYGPPPHGTVWANDHPMASPVQLADGQWHCLMGYRLLEWKENTHFIPPSPQTGSYLDEIVSIGKPRPPWIF